MFLLVHPIINLHFFLFCHICFPSIIHIRLSFLHLPVHLIFINIFFFCLYIPPLLMIFLLISSFSFFLVIFVFLYYLSYPFLPFYIIHFRVYYLYPFVFFLITLPIFLIYYPHYHILFALSLHSFPSILSPILSNVTFCSFIPALFTLLLVLLL